MINLTILTFIFASLALGVGLFIALAAIKSEARQRELWHETARIALEKGQPVPSRPPTDEELKHPLPPPGADLTEWSRIRGEQQRQSDIRKGLILMGVGAGLYLMMGSVGSYESRWVGAIPGFIGLALFLHGLLAHFMAGKR